MGGQAFIAVARFRGGRQSEDEGGNGPRGLYADTRAGEGLEDRDSALAEAVGGGSDQGRRQCRRALQGLRGEHREVWCRFLTPSLPPRLTGEVARRAGGGRQRSHRVKRSLMDRIIDTIEAIAALFVGLVAADIFLSVLLRRFFSLQIPDSYDFGRMLLGILIFWGIAATSYRGGHITVDLVWASASPRWKRAID